MACSHLLNLLTATSRPIPRTRTRRPHRGHPEDLCRYWRWIFDFNRRCFFRPSAVDCCERAMKKKSKAWITLLAFTCLGLWARHGGRRRSVIGKGESGVVVVENHVEGKFDRRITYPWKGDADCSHLTTQLADRSSLPRWPLTSFPGSGVTWVRQLIEGITGIYTGSVYPNDGPLLLEREIEETSDAECGCTIITKDHEATMFDDLVDYYRKLYVMDRPGDESVAREYGYRGVLLLRNPLDVAVTYLNWRNGGKTGHAPEQSFKGSAWDRLVDEVSFVWADHAVRWIERVRNGTVIFYETLLLSDERTLVAELKRLLDTIGYVHPIDPQRIECVMKHRDRQDFKRANKTRVFYAENNFVTMLHAIHKVQQSLNRKGWPRLPLHLYDFHY